MEHKQKIKQILADFSSDPVEALILMIIDDKQYVLDLVDAISKYEYYKAELENVLDEKMA